MRGVCGWLTLSVLASACELQEVTIAEPADLVVAEILLQTDVMPQRGLLHRTRGPGTDRRVPGATVEIREVGGRVMLLESAPPATCLDIEASASDPGVGTCYVSSAATQFAIRPGQTYSLRITLAGGGVMTARTTAPGDFSLLSPAASTCRLAPDSTYEMRWSRSDGAWAYFAETSLSGIRAALEGRGIAIDSDPLRLIGLAIGREDTTIVFPSEFGLFDRAEPRIADALLAIRAGLPPDVTARTIIAAGDRNWVNWARGGNFNPSGFVRVPSIQGDGTGVFGALVVKQKTFTTRDDGGDACRDAG
jgi:hypothetical protein